ncbi:MAG: hypothetical protein HGB12_02025 [Bacteroidetes bacterium]|nr:hypothetical protein [Bacteroidota bacterium]
MKKITFLFINLLFVVLMGTSQKALGAIAFDASSTFGESQTSSATFSHTCSGANRILFVGGWVRGVSNFVTSITYNGIPMTQIGNQIDVLNNGGYHDKVFLFYLINPTSGTNNIIVTYTSTNWQCVSAVSYTGAKQSLQPDNFANNGPTSTNSLTTTLSTVADNCWTILAGLSDNGNTSAGAGTTLRKTASNAAIFDSNGPITPNGSTSLIFSAASENKVAVMASFAPAVSYTPATVDWNNSNVQEITLAADRSFTFVNGKSGGVYTLLITQDATAGRTVTWPANVKWTGSTAPTLSSSPDAVDIIKFVYNGTNYLETGRSLGVK